MKTISALILWLAVVTSLPGTLSAQEKIANNPDHCGCECCKGKSVCCCKDEKVPAKKSENARSYPLKGVIIDLLPKQSALVVKHEEIPGYMAAMTMIFKVDAATLKLAVKNQAITARLSRRGTEFWLEEIRPVSSTPQK